jgi:hypothetical protein
MFFIFGSPRSGTTLLAQSLNAHTSVVVPNETDFVIPLAFLCDRVRDPAVGRELVATAIVSGAAFERSIGKFLTDTEVRECVHDAAYAVSAIIERIYARIAEKAGKRIAGDKSPNDLLSQDPDEIRRHLTADADHPHRARCPRRLCFDRRARLGPGYGPLFPEVLEQRQPVLVGAVQEPARAIPAVAL